MKEELIIGIHNHNSFPELKKELKETRPLIPTYDYQNDNTEEWKANSFRQEGFDLCLSIFKINLKE